MIHSKAIISVEKESVHEKISLLELLLEGWCYCSTSKRLCQQKKAKKVCNLQAFYGRDFVGIQENAVLMLAAAFRDPVNPVAFVWTRRYKAGWQQAVSGQKG